MADVDVRPVTADLWPTLERFFGPAGAYANCWCAFFRQRSKGFAAGCRSRGGTADAMLTAVMRHARHRTTLA